MQLLGVPRCTPQSGNVGQCLPCQACNGGTLGAYQSVIDAADKGWQCFVDTFLEQHFQHISDIASVVEREQPWVALIYLHGDSDSSLVLGPCSLSTTMHVILLKSGVFTWRLLSSLKVVAMGCN